MKGSLEVANVVITKLYPTDSCQVSLDIAVYILDKPLGSMCAIVLGKPMPNVMNIKGFNNKRV